MAIATIGGVLWASIVAIAGKAKSSVVSIAQQAVAAAVAYVLPTTCTPLATNLRSAFVQGNKCYSTGQDGIFRVYDVSSPLNPVLLGSVATSFGTVSCIEVRAVYNDVAWVVRSQVGGYGGATYLSAVNCANPAAPVVAGTLTTATGSSITGGGGVFPILPGGYMLVMDYATNSKVYVIDINNPSAPSKVHTFSLNCTLVNAGARQGSVIGSHYWMACNENRTLRSFNISNPLAVTAAGVYSHPEEVYALFVYGSYAYQMTSATNLRIINIANPSSPTLAANVTVPSGVSTMRVKNGYLIAFDGVRTQHIFSLANPIAPSFLGSSTFALPSGVTAINNTSLGFESSQWITNNYLLGFVSTQASSYNGLFAENFVMN